MVRNMGLYQIKLLFMILTFILIVVTLIQLNSIGSTKKVSWKMTPVLVQIYSSTFNSVQKPLLKLFIDVMKDFHVFLIEPKVLLSIVQEQNNITNDVFTFGMRADKRNILQLSSFDELKKHSFNVFPVIDLLSEDSDENKISHVILYHQSILVHLIIFYEKWEGFIKSEILLVSSFPQSLQKRLNFGEAAYGYNRLELATVYLDKDPLTLVMPAYVSRFVNEDIPESTFIECNFTTVNKFYAAYPDSKISYRNVNYRASRLLQDLRESMDDIGIKFLLDGGSLLGWYRQCDITHYNDDMDIEIYAKDYKPTLTEVLKLHGFYQTRQLGKLEDSFEMTFENYNMRLDVFLLYEGIDDNWTGGTSYNGTKYRFVYPKFQFCWGELLGVPVRVPCNTLEFVKNSYGDDWNKITEDWVWDQSPKNIKVVGNYSEEELVKYMIKMPPKSEMKTLIQNIFLEVYYFFIYLNIAS